MGGDPRAALDRVEAVDAADGGDALLGPGLAGAGAALPLGAEGGGWGGEEGVPAVRGGTVETRARESLRPLLCRSAATSSLTIMIALLAAVSEAG